MVFNDGTLVFGTFTDVDREMLDVAEPVCEQRRVIRGEEVVDDPLPT